MQIYILRDNQQTGPFTEADVRAQLAAGSIKPDTMIWWEGLPEWKPVSQTQFASAPVGGSASGALPTQPPPAAAYVPGGERTSGLAIGALITGIVGIFCAPILGVTAVILGHIARSQIRKDPTLKGSGMALAGLILGYVWIAFFIVYLIVIASMGKEFTAAIKKAQDDVAKQQQLQQQQAGNTNETVPPAPAPEPATPPPAAPDNTPPAPAPSAPAPATPPSQ